MGSDFQDDKAQAMPRRRRDEITPELMPPQDSAPVSRPNSIFGQRFITTRSPAASARAAASSLRRPTNRSASPPFARLSRHSQTPR